MFELRPAAAEDVGDAIAALGDAFADDPLMAYFFGETADGVRSGAMAFFSLLLRARIALRMPASVLRGPLGIAGAVMGYDTARPSWPAPLAEEWRGFEEGIPGFSSRLSAYERLCDAHQPSEDHYYLGVIGVHPTLQGKGAGKALLDAFCALSRDDPRSKGVYLDTSNPKSLRFYRDNGFDIRGEGSLGGTPLWCVYRPT